MEVLTLSAVLALVSALFSAVGSVAQHGAATQVANKDNSGLALMTGLARQPVWWAGFLGDAGGYGFQAIALGLGPLLLVQPLLVASLVFALPISAYWRGRKVVRSDLGWAVALSAALLAFLVIGDPSLGVDHASLREWATVGCALLLLTGGCVLGATFSTGALRAGLLAVTAGAFYGLTAALTKSVVDILAASPLEALTYLGTYALVGSGTLGFYFQQAAFQAGSIGASLPAITLVEPVVAAAIGIGILEEHIRADGPALVMLGLSAVVMVVSTVALSLSSARAGIT